MAGDLFGTFHDVRIEKAVLGVCLILEKIPEGVELKPNDFYRNIHSRIWDNIQVLDQLKVPVNVVSLDRQLKRNGMQLWPSYLTECVIEAIPDYEYDDTTTMGTMAIQYDKMIQNLAFKRKLAQLKGKLINSIVRNQFNDAQRILGVILEAGND